ncbi:MAG TPA: hypothetical protein VFH51_20060 [Myxococcota bacterium]|nr:hypothetical protein [Myxococcota bacterium]
MALNLDPTLYPHLARYLDAVPGGLQAHPQCKTTSDFTLRTRQDATEALAAATLPAPVRERLVAPWEPGEWIPTTNNVMLMLLMRDRVVRDDAAFWRYNLDRASEVFRQPLYKALMFVLSPSLMVLGAAKRWGKFHQGTELVSRDISRQSAKLEVRFPEHLFPELWLGGTSAAFCAAVACAGAAAPAARLHDVSPTGASFDLTWT